MRILVDTHLAIWSLINSNKLSKRAKDILENKNNELYISSISIWETELKHEIKPNDIILKSMLFLTHDEKLQNYKNVNVVCV